MGAAAVTTASLFAGVGIVGVAAYGIYRCSQAAEAGDNATGDDENESNIGGVREASSVCVPCRLEILLQENDITEVAQQVVMACDVHF
jgi:hypothetical protein